MQFTLKSLNGRFTWASLSFLAILLGLTLYSQHSVRESSARNLEYIRNNQLLSENLNGLTNVLEDTESQLHRYSSYPHTALHTKILHSLAQLNQRTAALAANSELLVSDSLKAAGRRLVTQTRELTTIIKHYLDVMQNVQTRYPGMPILLQYLEPSNQRFSQAVELAIQNEGSTDNSSVNIQRQHYHVIQLFQEARYAWAMQVNWFRIFVANRMGAFGDPQKSMKNNLENHKLFAKQVAQTLHQLSQLDAKNQLDFQQQQSLRQMRKAMDYYNQHLQQAIKIYSSRNWSADANMQRNSVQPALQRFWQTLHRMENGIAETNQISIRKSQATTKLLSHFIWIFTGIIGGMLFLAYDLFQRKIRKPLLLLTHNMQASGGAERIPPVSQTNVEEINQLLIAYNGMREQVDNRQRRLQSILDNAAEGIIIIDRNGYIENFNKAACELFQYRPDEVKGKPFSSLFPDNASLVKPELKENFPAYMEAASEASNAWELTGQRRDKSRVHLLLKFSEMQIAGQMLYTAIVENISERREVMERLRYLAEHDSLTGLFNRQYFNDELERAVARAERNNDYGCACIYIDLDNFKYINDTMGHIEGDRLLEGIANTLSSRVRKTDVLARLGGDEFALLLHDVNKEQAAAVADEYREAIATHSFITGGKRIDTGCSIGVALYEWDLENKEELLARADIACHIAKRSGRNRVYIFEHEDKNRIDSFSEEIGWARRIRYALEHDGFTLVSQPMLNISNGSICSHELLLRMLDPATGQHLLPGGFLDSAERFGLMPELDRWVVQHAFALINQQNRQGQGSFNYFINLSGKSIGDACLLAHIKKLLPALDIEPARIVFEITEDVAIADLEHARVFLHELHELGFKTALDDFGVGYSSFSYLRELDVDFIKIDGSFINAMHTDELNYALVKAMNDICHILGKKTVAEFVQNDAALQLLKEIGVDYAQGNNIAAAAEFEHHIYRFHLA